MGSGNPVVGIDVTARLDAFREELKKIPDIGAKEARALTTQLSREIKRGAKEAKRSADASKRLAKAQMGQAGAASAAFSDLVPVFAALKQAAVGFGVAVGAALAGMTALAIKGTFEVLDLSSSLNELNKEAGQIGVSVEEFQRLDGALKMLTKDGVDTVQAIQDFQKRTGEAAPNLAALADEFDAIRDPAARTTRAMELFGEEAGRKLAGALSQGGAALRDAQQQIEETGLATTQQAVQAAALQDELQLLKLSVASLKREALAPLIPVFAGIAEGIRSVLLEAGRMESFREAGEALAEVFINMVVPALAWWGERLDSTGDELLHFTLLTRAAIKAAEGFSGALRGDFGASKRALSESGGLIVEAKDAFLVFHDKVDENKVEWAQWAIDVQFAIARAQIAAADFVVPEAPTGKPSAEGDKADAGPDEETKRILAAVRDAIAAYDDLADAAAAAELAQLGGIERIVAEREASVAALDALRQDALGKVVGDADERMAIERQFEAGRIAVIATAAQQIDDIRQQSHDEEIARIEERRGAEREATKQVGMAWSSLAMHVGGLAGDIATAVGDSAKEGSWQQIRAARVAWTLQSGMALLQAGVNIPLAISQGTAAPYPQNLVLPALMGAAAGAAFAGVAVKAGMSAPFHRGGVQLQADETVRRFRQGEGALSQTGVRTAGGPAAVHAMNRGAGGGGVGPIYIVNQTNNRTTDVQAHEALRRPSSGLATAVRRSRSRPVGSALVWS